MRIYLDNCCYNRPYDDQTQMTIYKPNCIYRIVCAKVNLNWLRHIYYAMSPVQILMNRDVMQLISLLLSIHLYMLVLKIR